MNTQITFGKYRGYTAAQLKSIDSNYLWWGAQNLRSDFWRKEFAQALSSVTRNDTIAEMVHWDNISPEEASAQLRHMDAIEEADRQAEAAEQAKEDAFFAKWAAVIGKSVADTRQIRRYWASDWQDAPASRFSSPEAHRNFCAMMTEYDQLFV